MAQNSPNTINQRDGFLDHIARWLQVTAFTDLDAVEQLFVQDAFELALDRVAAEFNWADLRQEFEFNTGLEPQTLLATVSGTTGVVDPSSLELNDAAATFQNDNIDVRDAVLINMEKVYRVSVIPSAETTLTMTQLYTGAASTTAAYTVGRDIYPLPDDMGWLVSVLDQTDGRVIPVLAEDDFLHKTEGRGIFGRARVAMLGLQHPLETTTPEFAQRELRLWPIPDETRGYRVRYIRLPEYAVGGTDQIEFGNSMQAMLIHAVLVDVHARRGTSGDESGTPARFHEAKYQQMVRLFSKRDVNRSHQEDLRMSRQWIPGRRFDGISQAVGKETVEE